MKPGHINDFAPETLSLINLLKTAGCVIHSGSNGEDRFSFDGDLKKFIDELLACDEAWLYVITPGTPFTPSGDEAPPFQRRKTLYLVLGNSPGELVCDYSENEILETVTTAHNELWDGKAQPTKPCPYAAKRAAFNEEARLAGEARQLRRTLQLGVAVENFND